MIRKGGAVVSKIDYLFLLRHTVTVYYFNGKYSEFVMLPQYYRATRQEVISGNYWLDQENRINNPETEIKYKS